MNAQFKKDKRGIWQFDGFEITYLTDAMYSYYKDLFKNIEIGKLLGYSVVRGDFVYQKFKTLYKYYALKINNLYCHAQLEIKYSLNHSSIFVKISPRYRNERGKWQKRMRPHTVPFCLYCSCDSKQHLRAKLLQLTQIKNAEFV